MVGRKLMLFHMFTIVNERERAAVARLLEFLSDRQPWHRSLWGIGVVLAMEELYEASIAMKQGCLSDAAVKRVACSLQKRVGAHPAFTDAEKAFLRQQVHQIPRAEGAAHFGIRELSVLVSADYLTRWARAVHAGNFKVEHFARSVAAYLLDQGFAGQYMCDFIRARANVAPPVTLPQLCEEIQAEMLASDWREFEVLLAFASVPSLPNGIPSAWLRGPAVIAWLKEQNFETMGVRAPVAMILKVRARDAVGAARAARSESDRYAARALIATGETLDRVPFLWVKGATTAMPIREDSRGVSVKELYREDRIFSTDTNQSVDAALELLAHLESSSPPAAIAGGWAAIEGLLADPSDRATAADNLATLVACSFPRAELTTLSYRAQRAHPVIGAELERLHANRERSRVLGRLILDDRLPEMPLATDQAAAARLRKLFANPGHQLQTIRDEIGESFHRLYRQRNLILHGGRLDSVALSASLRTVAKLAGAGMDRITHGHYVQHLKPLELVAKANLALARVNGEEPLACIEMLEVG